MSVGRGRYRLCKQFHRAHWSFFLLLVFSSALRAEDLDDYTLRINTFLFHSNPSGSIQGQGESIPIDLTTDLNFDSHTTFSGKVDWKFTRKNHLYLSYTPFSASSQSVLTRSFNFQGQTFEVGLTTQTDLQASIVAPGYQYDFFRGKRGHLGLGIQVDIIDASATMNAAAQVINGQQQAAISASGSLWAPLPVVGPQFRFYLTDSPRIFVEGDLYGMYFFGYGSIVSSSLNLGYSLSKHISVNGGYQLGSRVIVTNQDDRFGIHLTQKGALIGMQFSF
ncbi:MAG: hypothetical protein U0V70_12815 [Terriglobia bacterium]